MKLLLLLLLVAAHALAQAPRQAPHATDPPAEKGDQNAVTPWSRSRVWIVEAGTPKDWLPADEGFLEMPKKPAAKPAAPKMATVVKPKAVVPKTTRKPGATTVRTAAKTTTRRPSTTRKVAATTAGPRKARSIESVGSPLPFGRRLLSLTQSPQVR